MHHTYYRGCWHVFSRCFLVRYRHFFFPADRALHTEILPRSRGVAASGFPPLCNIPHCCLPQESGPCLSPSVAGHPLRSATDRRFGGPLPRQLANQTRVHPIPPEFFTLHHAVLCAYAVLATVSGCYPPVWGRLPTRYSPVRHSVTRQSFRRNQVRCFVRLACVRHAASVHPEPGSNSHVKVFPVQISSGFFLVFTRIYCFKVLLSFNRSVRLSNKIYLTA